MKQLSIIGHLGQDATIKDVNGKQFVEFSVAVNENYKRADNTEVESTQWFSCITKKLKLAPFLKKGDKVLVQGNFTITQYQDKEHQWRVGCDVQAFSVQFLTQKKDDEREAGIGLLRKLIKEEVQLVRSN